MHLLLTNDDGIRSGLLHVVSKAAAARGHRVTVSAPATQQSAKSHGFTVASPLLVRRAEVPGAQAAWAVEGTPVDSCRLGMMALADAPVELVISGINYGYNAGLAVYVSGTVGAAREAAFVRKPAIALSLEPGTPEETITYFADFAIRAAEKLAHYPAPDQAVCNINVPPVPMAALKPAVVCPLSRNIYKDEYERRKSPRGDTYFWLAPVIPDDHPTPGSDLDLLAKGHITITFLTPEGCNQADYADFPEGL